MFRRIRSWTVFSLHIVEHILFRMGMRKAQPSAHGRWEAIQFVLGDIVGWNRYIRTHNTDLIPRNHPAIFYGNHVKFDDPLYLFRATYVATGGGVKLGAMLRNDFFAGIPFLKSRFLDLDELLDTLGTHGISRDNVTISQLKRFVDVLLQGRSFILYPGRSRSCSGMLMDYRDSIQRPGGISFFLHAAQGRDADLVVSAMPAVRNFNPVTRHTSVIFGPEQFLPRGVSRDEQRAFDERLIEVLGPLVEINVAHIVSAMLYLRCLHGVGDALSVVELSASVARILDATDHPYIDPEDAADVDNAVAGALKFLKKRDLVMVKRGKVLPNVDAILMTPELTTKYRRDNTAKYLANQILHLGGLVRLIEDEVLDRSDSTVRLSPPSVDSA